MNTRLLFPSLAVIASALPMAGCLNVSAPFHGTQTQLIPHVAGSTLAISTGNGSITIHTATRPDVEIVSIIAATTKERLDAVKIVATRQPDGSLKVESIWPDGRKGPEGCSFTITLPDCAGLNLSTSNGAIAADSPTGPVTLNTSNGSAEITNAHGTVNASTSNGHITVELASDAKGPVTLDTANGSITLNVGMAFEGQIATSTSNGKTTFEGFDAAPKDGTIQVGSSTVKSTASTSNGRITVRRRK